MNMTEQLCDMIGRQKRHNLIKIVRFLQLSNANFASYDIHTNMNAPRKTQLYAITSE